jgi:hypothetical protein
MKIVLCGSTRFVKEGLWDTWNRKLTLAGHRVTTISFVMSHDQQQDNTAMKEHLDLVHLAKILDADAIFVLDQGGYIGFSTKREIAWAKMLERKVFYLSDSSHQHLGVASL